MLTFQKEKFNIQPKAVQFTDKKRKLGVGQQAWGNLNNYHIHGEVRVESLYLFNKPPTCLVADSQKWLARDNLMVRTSCVIQKTVIVQSGAQSLCKKW